MWRVLVLITIVRADYWDERKQFLDEDEKLQIGNNLILTDNEKMVNKYLMEFKENEWKSGFENPGSFPPSKHFFESRELIEKSEIFKIIKELPKGASLHSHDTAMVSFDYLFNNITHWDNLYICQNRGKLKLKFFLNPDSSCDWELVSAARKRDDGFDGFLATQLSLIVQKPKLTYSDINAVWSKFMNIFTVTIPMITYKNVFENYFEQVLQEFYDDNVMYVEFRGTLPRLYDLEGHTYGPLETVGIYKNISEKFAAEHDNFLGVKFIYAPVRRCDNSTMAQYMKLAKEIKATYPDFLAGFDLVGQEDLGQPLDVFVDDLKQIGDVMKLFFHAGETNWFGSSVDNNLIDAVLLGTHRIGHGYAMLKHPEVMRVVKERGIGVEIAPISNQVLMLVDDIRNHPASALIANGMPVVICNDDPGFWGAKGLSYDWYMAFMGLASKRADLKFLKQLALNSIKYSSLSEQNKRVAVSKWNNDWNNFIQKMIHYFSNNIV